MGDFQALLSSAVPVIRTEEWDRLREVAYAWRPPNAHVMPVSDTLSAIGAVLWTASYVLLIRRCFQDKSYGMPIFGLALNISWEVIYSFIYPPDMLNAISFAPWAIVDVFLFVATARYGKHEWRHAPLVANNLVLIMIVSTVVAFWFHLALTSEMIPIIGRQVVFYASAPPQLTLSVGSVIQLLSRGHTRGHSIHIWWTRFGGSLTAFLCFLYRAVYWPERFGYAGKPLAVFYIIMTLSIDVVYIIVFLATKRRETPEARSLGSTGDYKKVK